MTEFRCNKCHKLLGKYKGDIELEIKCPRCGKSNHLIKRNCCIRSTAMTVKTAMER